MLIAGTDTETTGVARGSRMVEFACVLYDTEARAVVDRFESLVNPGMPIPPDTTDLHSITDDMVRNAPDASTVLADWLAWLPAGATLAIHSAPFDVGIVTYDAQRFGVPVPSHLMVIDTLEVARSRNGRKGNKLDQLIERYGIQRVGESHRAGSDAEACVQVLLAMHNELPVSALHEPTPWDQAGHDYGYTNILPPEFSALPDAVTSAGPFRFKYEDAHGGRTERTITPYGWALKDGLIYFNGICQLRGGERREFRADRVLQVL